MSNQSSSGFNETTFSPFDKSETILLNDSNDPDFNIFNNEQLLNTSLLLPDEAKFRIDSLDKGNFSILHLNVRSLNKNFDDF